MNPAIVWRFCLAGMIATCAVATLWPSTLCSKRMYRADYIGESVRADEVDFFERVFASVHLGLLRSAFQLECRDARSAWWRGHGSCDAFLYSRFEQGSLHLHFVQWGGTKSEAFLHVREILEKDLTHAFGRDGVRVVRRLPWQSAFLR